MSNEIVKSDTQMTVSETELISHLENLGLIKDLTIGERNTYLSICKAFNLNPFKREVHVSKYNGQMAVITGYETYIKRAERSGLLDGWEVKTEGSAKDMTLKAIITIWRKDRSRPFIWEAKYSEYVKMKDGKPNQFWQKAETMTKKVVMAQGFRLCFSDELGGMPYTGDEVGTEDTEYQAAPANESTHTGKAQPIQQPAAAAQPKPKSKLNPKAVAEAVGRIAAGEVDLIAMLTNHFDLSTEQLAELEAAKNSTPESTEQQADA